MPGGRRRWFTLTAVPVLGGSARRLSGGWLKGLEILKVSGDDNADDTTRRVLLLADGQANAGITDPGALAGMATRHEAPVCFGACFAEELLTATRSGRRRSTREGSTERRLRGNPVASEPVTVRTSTPQLHRRPSTAGGI